MRHALSQTAVSAKDDRYMKKFKKVHYVFHSDKIKDKRGARFVLLADLHGIEYGQDNRQIVDYIEVCRPDAVLLAGDMIVTRDSETLHTSEKLLKKLAEHYPVYYVMGNHEAKSLYSSLYETKYLEYERRLTQAGVRFLHNEREKLTVNNNEFTIYGLEIPLIYYKKPCSPFLTTDKIKSLIGKSSEDTYDILLTHSPKYGDSYFKWGADLILCGHYHGGIMRLTRHCGLFSPQGGLFPGFCCGDFSRKSQHMLVSAGMGEHTIPIRIHNPRELLVIDIKKKQKEEI